MVLESQTREFVFFVTSVGACKGLIEKESMDLELAHGRVSKFYM